MQFVEVPRLMKWGVVIEDLRIAVMEMQFRNASISVLNLKIIALYSNMGLSSTGCC
jgi:hypothetical protein